MAQAGWRGSKDAPAYLGLAFVVLTWGFNFVCVKLAFQEWSPPALMLARYLLQLPFFIGLLLVAGSGFSAPKKLWPRILLSGCLASGVYMVLFMEAMKRMGSAQGAVTMATTPLFIALLSAVTGGDKLSRNWTIGTFLAFTGVVFSNLDGLLATGANSTWLGFILMLTAALVWAVGVIVIRPVIAELGSIKGMALTMPGAMIVLLPYGIWSLIHTPFASFSPTGWWTLAYLVVVAGALAFMFYYYAIEQLGPARATVTQYLIPPTAAVFAWFVFGNEFKAFQWVGLVLALVGVFVAQRREAPPIEGTIEA